MPSNTRGRSSGGALDSAGLVITSGENSTNITPNLGLQELVADATNEAPAASDINTRTVKVTFFKNEAAQRLHVKNLTLPDLSTMIASETAASKMELRWLKLATFGNKRSDKNCLRTNENTNDISGIEVEHDVGDITFEDAIKVMQRHRLRGLAYTSPSHVAGVNERWRILLPLSIHYPTAMREKLVARINGLFDGKLAPESFTLSQAYLFGSVDNPDHRAVVLDGDHLDLRDDLYAGSIFRDGGRIGDHRDSITVNGDDLRDDYQHVGNLPRDHDPEPVDRYKIDAALSIISSNCDYATWLKVGAALHFEFGKSGFEIFEWWSAKSPQYNAAECKERWRGVRTMKDITAGTIFHLADQSWPGWRNMYEENVRNGIYADIANFHAERKAAAKDLPQVPLSSPAKASLALPLEFYESFSTAPITAKPSIIKSVIAKGERSSWVGPPSSGKSGLLTDIVVHVASGKDWRGYRSKDRCAVVYFALERGRLVKRRLAVQAMQAMGPPNLPIAVASQVINLLNSKCVAIIVETIRAVEAHYKIAVGMIVIDTYNKGIAAGGGDESSAKDQNITAANLQRVEDQTGVHTALIGHTGKDEKRGARGSNAHLGDVDMMVQFSINDDGTRTATITKINDGAEGVLTRFKMEAVILGKDEDGDDITTAIVSDDRFESDKDISRAKLNKSQRRAMEMLERALENGKQGPTGGQWLTGIGRVVTIEEWRTACIKGGLSPAGTKEAADKAFRRAMGDLIAAHRVGVWDGLVWIAYE